MYGFGFDVAVFVVCGWSRGFATSKGYALVGLLRQDRTVRALRVCEAKAKAILRCARTDILQEGWDSAPF